MLKKLFPASAAFIAGALISCAHSGISIKVYRVDPANEALVRKQSNESIPIKDAEGYYCTSRTDFETLVTAYKSCLVGGSQ